MTAVLIFEAIDTASAIANAILAWIVAGAFVATVVLFTLIATVAHGCKTVRRRVTRRSWARGRLAARKYAAQRTRGTQRRTADPAYEEAA